ncbi:uncharacterized protein BCR38DRAFT_416499 [Pseudomassariella vexata]|uniref:Ribosomal protein bL31m N-terminal domain-containing protein n=1 Tax=Pseudomassariella vexata TaxID=1141098 RepID=A0A1Y2EID4_9PEZI|nr:uncharacterized protein BCR38DRAFT_416499 [Pseudomassariella vexata]ORY71338.1 hypothetical protein BCR38DRAFT_416499 [Pseudomassariella vexata]
MATRIPRRPTTLLSSTSALTPQTTSRTPQIQTQTRNATLIRRPRRPYTFTQLVQLSDGSTYTMRTSSPLAMYKPSKDSRNHMLWNPSEKSLKNVEVDEAGKLAAFRERFGRGWDAKQEDSDAALGGAQEKQPQQKQKNGPEEESWDTDGRQPKSVDALGDLISGYHGRNASEYEGRTKGKK